ncbi:MAG: radical SAM protein [Candidatus Bathyarchaeota archaeon]|nr:radical SAM protein [Candidatus Bathyarchaeota archaeon]
MAPDRLRVSVGTASVLGLLKYRLAVPPTTAYIMSYTEGSCTANCAFCAQARDHTADKEHLSRVVWPDFTLESVLEGFRNPAMNVLERICVQVIIYPGFLQDTLSLVKLFRRETELPVSVDICPVSPEALQELKDAGADRIGIPLDGSTPEIFDKVKGKGVKASYRWKNHFKALQTAVEIFGETHVGSNIIVGLGETERDVVELIQRLHNLKIMPVLFAFTPLKGTRLEHLPQPPVDSYRRLQAARYLIVHRKARLSDIQFSDEGRITGYGDVDLAEALSDGEAFRTTGCPGCNRPFYNERPSGPFYNYPRPLSGEEVKTELRLIGVEQDD